MTLLCYKLALCVLLFPVVSQEPGCFQQLHLKTVLGCSKKKNLPGIVLNLDNDLRIIVNSET